MEALSGEGGRSMDRGSRIGQEKRRGLREAGQAEAEGSGWEKADRARVNGE